MTTSTRTKTNRPKQRELFTPPKSSKTKIKRPPKPEPGDRWWASFLPVSDHEWAEFISAQPQYQEVAR